MAYRIADGRVLFSLFVGHEEACEADAATFRALGESYGVDSGRVFFQGAPVEGADVGTFEAVGAFHGRDAHHVFWRSRVIEGASPSSFDALGWDYGRDGGLVFECAAVLQGVDAATFEVLDEAHTRDVGGVYRFGKRVADVLPSDVEIWGPYVRLGRVCAYRSTPIDGADASSFRGLNASDYAVDASRAYYVGAPIRGADAASFTVLGLALASDKRGGYVGGDRYEGAVGGDWSGLDLTSLRARVVARRFAKAAAAGDARAMASLARNELENERALEALVWALLVPVFGGKRLAKVEADARLVLDPHQEIPELVPEVSLAVARKLWRDVDVPRRSEEAQRHLGNAIREGLLTLLTMTRAALVEEFGEEMVSAAEIAAGEPPNRKRRATPRG